LLEHAQLIACRVIKDTVLMASSSVAQVQEALALLQKTSSTDGGSLYDQLTKLVVKVLANSWFQADMQHLQQTKLMC
jgi:hypothetical protein